VQEVGLVYTSDFEMGIRRADEVAVLALFKRNGNRKVRNATPRLYPYGAGRVSDAA
jgi:hypothetical protein